MPWDSTNTKVLIGVYKFYLLSLENVSSGMVGSIQILKFIVMNAKLVSVIWATYASFIRLANLLVMFLSPLCQTKSFHNLCPLPDVNLTHAIIALGRVHEFY